MTEAMLTLCDQLNVMAARLNVRFGRIADRPARAARQ